MTVLAVIGTKALWLTYGWLLCGIVASYLAERKGYRVQLGIALGLILVVVGIVILLILPARPESDWKVIGPFGRGKPGQPG